MDILTLALLCTSAALTHGQSWDTIDFQGALPTATPGQRDLDPDECGRAPNALREALLYTVARQDSNADGIIDPTDLEWENILYSSGEGEFLCGEDEIRVGCPVICVTSANEWANGWECFYGFDRGFAMATFNYFEINYIPGYPPVGNGDGGMLNRDLKDRLFPMAPLSTADYTSILARLFREYCATNSTGKFCDQQDDIADL